MASYAMGAVRKGEVCMGGRGTRGGGGWRRERELERLGMEGGGSVDD